MEAKSCGCCGKVEVLIGCYDIGFKPEIQDCELNAMLHREGYLYHCCGGYDHTVDGMSFWFKGKPFEGGVCEDCFMRICYRMNCLITYYMFQGNGPLSFAESKAYDSKRFVGAIMDWEIQRLQLEMQRQYQDIEWRRELAKLSKKEVANAIKMKAYNEAQNNRVFAMEEEGAAKRMGIEFESSLPL